MGKTKPPAMVEVNLDLGAFTYSPAKRREDGGMKSQPAMVLKATHRDAPVRELMEFLGHVSGLLKIRVTAADLGPGAEAWEGFGEIHAVHLKPPGPRAEEQGGEDHPTVEIPLALVAGAATDLHSLMGLRLYMDDAGSFGATVSLQVWQEDLPFGSEADSDK